MKRLFSIMIMVIFAAVLLSACGKSGDDTPPGGGTLQTPTYNATGKWTVTETGKQGNCTSLTPNGTFTLTVDHPSGSNSLTVLDDNSGKSYAGTCDGSTITYSGPGVDSDCPGGFSLSVTMTMQSDSNLSGSANWTCNYTGGSCSGTTTFTATKQGGGSGGGGTGTGGALSFYEEKVVGKFSRYHAYDGSTMYFIFKNDRTGCYFEITSTYSRRSQSSYVYWKLDEQNPVSQYVFKIYKQSSGGAIYTANDEFHYLDDTIWKGAYNNLSMIRSNTTYDCQ